MTNRELRKAARGKAVAKGVTPVLFLAYAPSILININNNLGGLGIAFQIHWAVWYVIQFAILLFSYAGGARVSLAAWERGEARVSGLVAYFAHGRLFLRALAVAVFTTALSYCCSYALGRLTAWLPMTAVYLIAFPLAFLTVLFLMSLNYLYFAIDLVADEPIWRTILSGTGKIARRLWRIVCMAVALWWWVIIIIAVVYGLAFYNLPRAASLAILVAMLTVIYWFLGPYFRLAQAGLAIEIFRGENAAADEPEEEAPVTIEMGPFAEYLSRAEDAPGAKEE